MMEKLVFDTSAILNCGKRGECEFLLERLAEKHALLTTPEVEQELCDPKNADFYRDVLKRRFKIQGVKSVKIEMAALKRLTTLLGRGELSVILLAMELKAVVVLDEKVARVHAAALSLQIIGTLGLLAEGIKRNWCTDHQCIGIAKQLHKNGFRIRLPYANESFEEYFASFRGQARGSE
jgi:predicted nucleic acid-binding protein